MKSYGLKGPGHEICSVAERGQHWEAGLQAQVLSLCFGDSFWNHEPHKDTLTLSCGYVLKSS